MNYKQIAQETVAILEKGYYQKDGRTIDLSAAHRTAIEQSRLITLAEGAQILAAVTANGVTAKNNAPRIALVNAATTAAILSLQPQQKAAVLNFASAKNPGGGFLNGAMAQEESLATSGGLYDTLLAHEEYYRVNRATASMSYTDLAIFSPEVVFFRDEHFALLPNYVTASVLTIPAVNMGQVAQKRQDISEAKKIMRNRMRLVLALFAHFECPNIILGAYGCGVFHNDPAEIARWWHELLIDEGLGGFFEQIIFAVLDRSKTQANFAAFDHYFGRPTQ